MHYRIPDVGNAIRKLSTSGVTAKRKNEKMARKKIECITCDRCNKVYEEKDGEATASDAELTLESRAGDISFEDLCNKCTKRVADLVGQIRMDPKEKKEGEAKSPDEKTAPSPDEKTDPA